jgi:hypothetical protein
MSEPHKIRWPFAFTLEEISVEEVKGAADQPGYRFKHAPTGAEVTMAAFSDKEINYTAGLRRLDREVRRAQDAK